MTLSELKELRDSGQFHHATYRNQRTLWEGLWIYRKSETGLRGFAVAGCFNARLDSDMHPRTQGDTEIDDAMNLVSDTGISVGAYGQG